MRELINTRTMYSELLGSAFDSGLVSLDNGNTFNVSVTLNEASLKDAVIMMESNGFRLDLLFIPPAYMFDIKQIIKNVNACCDHDVIIYDHEVVILGSRSNDWFLVSGEPSAFRVNTISPTSDADKLLKLDNGDYIFERYNLVASLQCINPKAIFGVRGS